MDYRWLNVIGGIIGLLLIYFLVYFLFIKKKLNRKATGKDENKQPEIQGLLEDINKGESGEMPEITDETDQDLLRMITAANQDEIEETPLDEFEITLIEKIKTDIDSNIDLLNLNKIGHMLNRKPLSSQKIIDILKNSERFK